MGFIHTSGLAGDIVRYRPKKPYATDEFSVLTDNTDLAFERVLLNGTSTTFRVASRTGLVFTIPPHPATVGKNVLIVREHCLITENGSVDVTSALNENSEMGRQWADASSRRVYSGYKVLRTQAVATELSERDFAACDTLYLKDYDLVISASREGRLIHPYSEEGEVQRHCNDMPVSGNIAAGGGITFELVDPHKKAGPKFVNLFGQIYRVPAIVSNEHPEGLYVIRNGISEGSMSSSPPLLDRYDLDDLSFDTIGFYLYDSVQEALSHGDVEKSLARERMLEANGLKQLEHEMKVGELELKRQLREQEQSFTAQQNDWNREKFRLEQDKIRLTQENEHRKNEMERMQHQLDMKSMERKDLYEQRSHERKDTLEYLKFLPLALAALMGVFVAFRK